MSYIGMPELLVLLVLWPIFIAPFWKIFGKAGFPPWLALFMGVPIINIIVLYYVAFSDWKRPA